MPWRCPSTPIPETLFRPRALSRCASTRGPICWQTRVALTTTTPPSSMEPSPRTPATTREATSATYSKGFLAWERSHRRPLRCRLRRQRHRRLRRLPPRRQATRRRCRPSRARSPSRPRRSAAFSAGFSAARRTTQPSNTRSSRILRHRPSSYWQYLLSGTGVIPGTVTDRVRSLGRRRRLGKRHRDRSKRRIADAMAGIVAEQVLRPQVFRNLLECLFQISLVSVVVLAARLLGERNQCVFAPRFASRVGHNRQIDDAVQHHLAAPSLLQRLRIVDPFHGITAV